MSCDGSTTACFGLCAAFYQIIGAWSFRGGNGSAPQQGIGGRAGSAPNGAAVGAGLVQLQSAAAECGGYGKAIGREQAV